MNIRNFLIATVVSALPILACAQDKTASSPEIPIAIDFQSTAAAVATDTVTLFVYKNTASATQSCSSLIALRQTSQPLPPTSVSIPAFTPCDMVHGVNSDLTLDLKSSYTILAVGQIQTKDALIGCVDQPAYGSTEAVPVTLTFVDDRQAISDTTCAKLSDKCNGGCK